MRWVYLILATLCFALLLKTHSLGLAIFGLIGMLGFLLAGVLSMASARIDSRSRDQGQIVDAETLRHVRAKGERARDEKQSAGDDTSQRAVSSDDGSDPA